MLCIEEDCNKHAYYNSINLKVRLYCKLHAKQDMVDLKNKRCMQEDCDTYPSYNFINQKDRLYCKLHAKQDMVDLKNKRCIQGDCDKQPSFNFINKKSALYCKNHAKKDMISIKNKRCVQDNCDKHPSYNFINQKVGLYCKSHSKESMVDVKHKKCLENDCIIRPNYNYVNQKSGLYCKLHSKQDMIDVKHKKCVGCNDIRISNKIYKDHCLRCFIYKFPDVEITRNFKVKERYVIDYIKQEFNKQDFIFDKVVDNGCSKRRPDAHIDLLTHIIIIEIDENQHSNYENICENKRSMELFIDFGNRPIIFLRFNPDHYFINKIKIESSFCMHMTLGIPIIRNKIEWDGRLDKLKISIYKWLEDIPVKEITNEFLFYNQ